MSYYEGDKSFDSDMRKICLIALFVVIAIISGVIMLDNHKDAVSEEMARGVIEKYSAYEDIQNDFDGQYYVLVTAEYPSGKEIEISTENKLYRTTFFIRKDLSYNKVSNKMHKGKTVEELAKK